MLCPYRSIGCLEGMALNAVPEVPDRPHLAFYESRVGNLAETIES